MSKVIKVVLNFPFSPYAMLLFPGHFLSTLWMNSCTLRFTVLPVPVEAAADAVMMHVI